MLRYSFFIAFICSTFNLIAAQDLTIQPDTLIYDSLYTPDELVKMDIPELCPEGEFQIEQYDPAFFLEADYYKERYQEKDLMYKVVDNWGNGFDSLYGTRNMRPILHGIAYRGGGNNYFHKENKRKNNNPLPDDGIKHLCQEGFAHSIYLYRTNWDTAPTEKECDCVNDTKNTMEYSQFDYFDDKHVYEMLKLVHKSATDKNTGPVYLHCWNGWHASGFISAVILKQFCGYSDLDAVSYWDLGTDGANTSPRYNSIRERIKNFEPYPEFILNDSMGNYICPPMPEFIDSSQLHISVEHLVIVPEAIPLNTILILDHVKFGPGKTTFSNASSNEDLKSLISALEKSADLKIEIGGHTDRSGNENTNKQLSKSRAKFVYDHLIKNGIAAERLTYKGYGSSKPAYTNKSKSGRAANRRIEIKVLQKKAESQDKLVDETPAPVDPFEKHETDNLNHFENRELNTPLILKHIVFEPNMMALTEEAKLQVDTLANILTNSPNLKIEITGYTDKSGIEDKNITLSINRAKSVYDYLIEKGVDPERLYYVGCGSENPIAPNAYRWGRDINRRIEVVILEK